MHVANVPTCGPLLILSATLKRRGAPGGQGLCSHLAHRWPTFDLSQALKRWGTPRRQGLCSHLANLWATSHFVPRFEALGTPQAAPVLPTPCLIALRHPARNKVNNNTIDGGGGYIAVQANDAVGVTLKSSAVEERD